MYTVGSTGGWGLRSLPVFPLSVTVVVSFAPALSCWACLHMWGVPLSRVVLAVVSTRLPAWLSLYGLRGVMLGYGFGGCFGGGFFRVFGVFQGRSSFLNQCNYGQAVVCGVGT